MDGDLRKIFQRYWREPHWQSIESGGTSAGIPDLNGCVDGREFWVEAKVTSSWKVNNVKPAQVGWIERRTRAGGRVFVAVRQRGAGRDVLWFLAPGATRMLKDGMRLDNLPGSVVLICSPGGPPQWDWESVKKKSGELTPLLSPGFLGMSGRRTIL
jgi:hypothetical protein